jgi:hypothetical protein
MFSPRYQAGEEVSVTIDATSLAATALDPKKVASAVNDVTKRHGKYIDKLHKKYLKAPDGSEKQSDISQDYSSAVSCSVYVKYDNRGKPRASVLLRPPSGFRMTHEASFTHDTKYATTLMSLEKLDD